MTCRRFATQSEVLHAVVERLRSQISRYNEANCFISDQPVPSFFPSGREVCTVSPGAGQFGDALFTGAGIRTLTEDAQVIVTPLIRHKKDRAGQSEITLQSEYDGLLVRKGEILSALLYGDHDLEIEDERPRTPEEVAEQPVVMRKILRNQITPTSCQAPGEVRVGKYELTGMSINFAAPFDWALFDVSNT